MEKNYDGQGKTREQEDGASMRIVVLALLASILIMVVGLGLLLRWVLG